MGYNNGLPINPLVLTENWVIMPKQKTHKGVKKRFRLTAKGKVKHRQAGTSHLATRKTHKQKRNLRGTRVLDDVSSRSIVAALAGHSY